MNSTITGHVNALKLPVLVAVTREARAITLRTFEEVVNGCGAATGIAVAENGKSLDLGHAATTGHRLHSKKTALPGRLLAARHAATTFSEVGYSTLLLDEVAGTPEWSDHACWLFPVSVLTSALVPGAPLASFNQYPTSYLSKSSGARYPAVARLAVPLRVYVPFATCDFSEASLLFTLNPAYGLVGNVNPGTRYTREKAEAVFDAALPKLALKGDAAVRADGYANITVCAVDAAGKPLTDADATVYLEAISGHLPESRVSLSAGSADFRVGALGLEPGHEIRVKAGFRFFTGLAEHRLGVV